MFRCFLKYIENACQIFDIYQASRTLKPPKTSKTDQDLQKKLFVTYTDSGCIEVFHIRLLVSLIVDWNRGLVIDNRARHSM